MTPSQAAQEEPPVMTGQTLSRNVLVSALGEIVLARRQLSHCLTPGTCLYPQHHSDDESYVEFAARLQDIAEKALIESGEA